MKKLISALLLAGIVCLVAMRVSAPYRHDRELRGKLPVFQEIIAELQAAGTPAAGSSKQVSLPEDGRGLVVAINAVRQPNNRLAVEFITKTSFPMKHRGFLFISDGSVESHPQMVKRWPLREKLQERWFYIGD